MSDNGVRKRSGRAALLAVAACLLVLGIGVWSAALGKANIEDKVRISVIMPHRDDGYWTYVVEGVEAGAEQYADRVDVKVYYSQLNYNVEQMTSIIKRQIAARVDVIIAQGNEFEDYQNILREAWSKGIQIVLVDTDIENFIPHVYIGTDNYSAGQELGRRLAELTGGQATVAVLSGQPKYKNLEDRYTGLTEISQTYPGIRFVRLEYDNFDSLTVLNKVEQIKAEDPEIDTLVCIEGTGGQTIGIYNAESLKKYKYILVFDYMQETLNGLENETINGVMAQEPYQMGYMAVQNIAESTEDGNNASYSTFTSIRWITKENLDEQVPGYEE